MAKRDADTREQCRRPQRWIGRQRWLWSVIAVICVSVVSTGCYDRKELEQQAFVVAMGLDKAPGRMIDCTLVIALPTSTVGGGESGQQPKAASGPVTIRARTVTEALQLANSSIERSITLSHLSSITFGSQLARSGVEPWLRPLIRFREFRRTVLLFAAQGTARGVLLANEPMVEKSGSRFADDVAQVGADSGLVPVVHLHDFLRALETAHEDPLLPLYAVNAMVKADPAGKHPLGVAAGSFSYAAGHIVRVGGNPVEWAGAAVFRDGRMVDEMDGQQVAYLQILRGTLQSTRYTFADPSAPQQAVTLRLRHEQQPQVNVSLGQTPTVRIDVPLEADLVEEETAADWAAPAKIRVLERRLSDELSQQLTALLGRLMHQDRVDVLPLSRRVRAKFATDTAFSQYPWERQMRRAQITVSSEVHIRRFGVQTKALRSR